MNVLFPAEYGKIIEAIKAYTLNENFGMYVIASASEPSRGYLLEPSLIPIIEIPSACDDQCWHEVAFQLIHIHRSCRGIQRLCAHGTPADIQIGDDINNTLEKLAIHKEAPDWGLCMPSPMSDLHNKTKRRIAGYNDDIIPAAWIMTSLEALIEGHIGNQEADSSIQSIRELRPDEVDAATGLFELLNNIDLREALGKESACRLILDAFKFDQRNFFFQDFELGIGVKENRPLGYYELSNKWRSSTEDLDLSSRTVTSFDVPFKLPIHEGRYIHKEGNIYVRHNAKKDYRATWNSKGASVDPLLDLHGLYGYTELVVSFPGHIDAQIKSPPNTDALYRNYDGASDLSRHILQYFNGFIEWIRKETSNPYVPNLTLNHLNKMHVTMYDDKNIKIYDCHASYELNRITAGPPVLHNASDYIVADGQIEFFEGLLEQAKLDCIESNFRRALLDLYGAFEGFVATHLSPIVGDLDEDTKQRFLRLHNLKQDVRQYIENNVSSAGDSRPASIFSIVKAYRKMEIKPLLEKDIHKILSIAEYRNDAAHGRPLPSGIQIDIFDAIEILEKYIDIFQK